MPSAKRPVRKSSPSGKAKPAAPAKARASRTATRKAARKPAPAKKAAAKAKPAAGKVSAKPLATTRAKVPAATKPVKTGKPAAVKAPLATQQAKASAPKTPAVREMIVRTTPGLVKTSGRKPLPAARKASRRPEVYDPNALIHGIRPYQTQMGEAYMSPAQLEHFRMILQAWKRELMEEVDRTVHHMQDEASNFPDPNDRATQESEFGLELRTRDRERKLLKKIDSALERIEDGSYGYCEETGEEIGLKRLEARPVATLSLEAQERREMAERQYGERDDRYR